MTDEELLKEMDEISNGTTVIVANPDAIERLIKLGAPIKTITYSNEEYVEKLFMEARPKADELVKSAPHLDSHIANSMVSQLFEEMTKEYLFDMPGNAISTAITLMELAFKQRIWKDKCKIKADASYRPIEGLDFKRSVAELHELHCISDEERDKLLEFNSEFRNNYIHYKVLKLIENFGMTLPHLPVINVAEGTSETKDDILLTEYPALWFSAKRVLDRAIFKDIVGYCVGWVNSILIENDD